MRLDTFCSQLPIFRHLLLRLRQKKTHFCLVTRVRFLNDVCLRQMMLATPMMTATPNDAMFATFYGKHRIIATNGSNIIFAKQMHHIAVRRCFIKRYKASALIFCLNMKSTADMNFFVHVCSALSIRVFIPFLYSEQIICRDLEILANCPYIFNARLVFVALKVRYLSLSHFKYGAELCLIQVCFFSENSDFVSNRFVHFHHPVKKLYNRLKMSIDF